MVNFKRQDIKYYNIKILNPNGDIWELILKLKIFTFIKNIFDLPTSGDPPLQNLPTNKEKQVKFRASLAETPIHPLNVYFYPSSKMLHINK